MCGGPTRTMFRRRYPRLHLHRPTACPFTYLPLSNRYLPYKPLNHSIQRTRSNERPPTRIRDRPRRPRIAWGTVIPSIRNHRQAKMPSPFATLPLMGDNLSRYCKQLSELPPSAFWIHEKKLCEHLQLPKGPKHGPSEVLTTILACMREGGGGNRRKGNGSAGGNEENEGLMKRGEGAGWRDSVEEMRNQWNSERARRAARESPRYVCTSPPSL